jgi:hypothetical protein
MPNVWDVVSDGNAPIPIKSDSNFVQSNAFSDYTTEQVFKLFMSLLGPHVQTGSHQQCGRCPLPLPTSLLKKLNEQLELFGLLSYNYDFYVIDCTRKKQPPKKFCSQRTHRGKYKTANVDINQASISVMFVCGQSGDGVDFVYSDAPTHGSNFMRDDSDSEYQGIGPHTTRCSTDEVRSQMKRKTLTAGKIYAIAGKTFMPEYPFEASSGSSSAVCVLRFVCLQGNGHQSNPFVLPCTSSALITRNVARNTHAKLCATAELRGVINRFDNLSAEESEAALQHYVDNSSGCYTAVPEVGHDAAELEAELETCLLHKGCGCLGDTSPMSLRQIADKSLFATINANQQQKRTHSQLQSDIQALKIKLFDEEKKRKAAEASLHISGGPVWGGVVYEVERVKRSRQRMEQVVNQATWTQMAAVKEMLSDCVLFNTQLGKDENGLPCDVVCLKSICGNVTFFNVSSITKWILQTGSLSKFSFEYKLAPKTPGASSTLPLPAEQVLAAINRHISSYGMTWHDVHKSSKWVQQVELYADPLMCPRPSLRGRPPRNEILMDLQHWQQKQHDATVVHGVETLETQWRKVCKEALCVFVDEKRAPDFLGPNITKELAVELTWCTRTNFIREIAGPAWKACEIVEQAHANSSVD